MRSALARYFSLSAKVALSSASVVAVTDLDCYRLDPETFRGLVRARPAITGVLQEPAYRRLWASGLCVSVVRWMDLVTLGWLSLEMTGSAFMVGLAAFARSSPMMFLGPFAGIVADRVSRGHVLLFTQGAGAVTAIALAALFATGRAGYWSLVALEIVFGLLWALDFPARRTALYSLLGGWNGLALVWALLFVIVVPAGLYAIWKAAREDWPDMTIEVAINE